MNKLQRTVSLAAVIGILSISGAVYADTLKTQAKEAGQFEAFQSQMLSTKEAILEQRVANGQMTQAKADEILAAIKANQAVCDGTGSAQIGRKMGAGFGGGMGMGQGLGLRDGSHGGMGFGRNVTQ